MSDLKGKFIRYAETRDYLAIDLLYPLRGKFSVGDKVLWKNQGPNAEYLVEVKLGKCLIEMEKF